MFVCLFVWCLPGNNFFHVWKNAYYSYCVPEGFKQTDIQTRSKKIISLEKRAENTLCSLSRSLNTEAKKGEESLRWLQVEGATDITERRLLPPRSSLASAETLPKPRPMPRWLWPGLRPLSQKPPPRPHHKTWVVAVTVFATIVTHVTSVTVVNRRQALQILSNELCL